MLGGYQQEYYADYFEHLRMRLKHPFKKILRRTTEISTYFSQVGESYMHKNE